MFTIYYILEVTYLKFPIHSPESRSGASGGVSHKLRRGGPSTGVLRAPLKEFGLI